MLIFTSAALESQNAREATDKTRVYEEVKLTLIQRDGGNSAGVKQKDVRRALLTAP